jgi:hypothetical protein
LGPAVKIHVAFMGLIDSSGAASKSMGETETAAALAHVCVQNQATEPQWLKYLSCAFGSDQFRSGKKGALSCALAVGLDDQQLKACTSSEEAQSELKSMYATSMALGIDESPTIVVERRVYLGEMKSASLASHLCHSVGEVATRPKACDNIPPPPSVNATLLFDSRCKDPDLCDVEGEVEALHAMVSGLLLTRLDYTTPEGRHLFELIRRAEPKFEQLPAILFDHSLVAAAGAAERLAPYLVSFGEGRLLPLSSGWNPQAEICDNGVDDTGDGKADCEDGNCKNTLACRAETKGKLELFIMSQCSFGAAVVDPSYRAVKHFGKDRKKLDLRIEFIGASRDGVLASMHGQAELDEDLRMMCAQSLYPNNYLFMDYVACRAKDFRSEDWKACVPKGMSAKKVDDCATTKKGRDLLELSFSLAEKLGVRGSPSWILNGRYAMDGRTAATVVQGFCERNDRAECKKEVAPEPEKQPSSAAPDKGSCQ